MSVPFRPLGDRVVIQADIEDRAPQQTESGLLTAKTLAAAVEGSDVEDSWFVGTVVAVGPLVNRFDVRPWVLKRLRELLACEGDTSGYGREVTGYGECAQLLTDIEALPADCPDPVQIGDRVCFSWAAGQQISVDGQRFLIMRQRDVLAVLDPDESE